VSPPLTCLLLFVAWTVALLLSVGAVRVWQVQTGAARTGDFPAGVPHGGERYWRLNRAHLNCVEFLPLFAVVVLTGAVLGVESDWVERLAVAIIAARVGQSLTHVASGSGRAIQVRFTFFAVQVASLIAMGVIVASHG
jgi:uncharacterized MAPEG superfamily protein